MFLEINSKLTIDSEGIIGIFDFENSTVSPATRSFLRTTEKNNMLTVTARDIPKSFILTDGRVYFTQNTSKHHLQKLNENSGLFSVRKQKSKNED